ncbi:MAG: hypothetical protein METHAR1v1_1240025 [Methanothrix sp.]|jgi:hypothetical protein|nr:MAG: hypothetical protein METHAR1v1_1240025 [Methanothrix sp.]
MIINMQRRTIRDPLLILAALAYLMTITTPCLAEAEGDLTGLWTFRSEEDQTFGDPLTVGEFTAAIFHTGTILSGAATGGEADPWNGMVTGSYEEGWVDLQVLLIREPLTILRMAGGFQEPGDLVGTAVSSDERGSGWRGGFSATMKTPDTSLYQPATKKPLSFVPTVSGGISDFTEMALPSPVEEAPKRRTVHVISYTRDTIYARPVM